MANCKLCNEPIVLVPSARERAKKYGETPAFYTSLFTTHSQCQIEHRNRQVRERIEQGAYGAII